MSSDGARDQQPAEISNLQQNFSKQQKKISALKELVRKSEVAHGKSTSSAQEKVKNIAQRLSLLKSKARSRQSLNVSASDATTSRGGGEGESLEQPELHTSMPAQLSVSFSEVPHASSVVTPLKSEQRSDSNKSLTTPSSEKVLLLRQRMEQSRALMAQRASSKQHLEQLVSQLKEKFDTTQQCLENTTELGKSMTDLSALMDYRPVTRERHKSATDLSAQSFNLDKERIKFLENRCRLLEKQLEKERQINAGQDVSLNESIVSQASAKCIKELENKVLELEKSVRDQQLESEAKEKRDTEVSEEMERLRSDLAARDLQVQKLELEQSRLERPNEVYELNELENENERLRNELLGKQKRIAEMEEVNDTLETVRCDLTMRNNQLDEQVQQLELELRTANQKLEDINEELKSTEAKCLSLGKALEQLQNTTEAVVIETRGDSTTDAQVRAEMAKQIQELEDSLENAKVEISELQQKLTEKEKIEVSDETVAEKMSALESTIESQREDLKSRMEMMKKQEEELMEKTIELNVLNANFKVLEDKLQASSKNKPLFSSGAAQHTDNVEMQAEIQQLKQKLDESNKAMIKLKLKCKQSEKQVEKLKKTSDLHAELARVQKSNEELQQKITELEDEKGQWQLAQVDDVKATGDVSSGSGSGGDEVDEKLKLQTETIKLLEQQKYELSEELGTARENLAALKQKVHSLDSEESERVKCEMSEIHLEETLQEQTQQITSLKDRLRTTEVELDEYKQKFEQLQTQKQAADKRLEHYIAENMELLDKVEKLSKSSSSAESIEIVERLTQQERAEIDEFNKRLDGNIVSSVNEITQTEMGPELSESLVKLREESSELMGKIELFTNERREVLEKMEHLTTENHELIEKIDDLTQEKEQLATQATTAEKACNKLELRLKELAKDKELLATQVAESSAQKAQLSQELTSLQKSSEVMAAIDGKESATLFDKCEKSLSKLKAELETYRKAGDRNAKFDASKKLAKEAKNAHTQLSELLQKVKESSTAVETVTVVETVVAVTAPNGKALAEYEQLTAQNRELKATVEELRRELQEAQDNEPTAEVPAITQEQTTTSAGDSKLAMEKLQADIAKYEGQCIELQSTVEDLRLQLREARLAEESRVEEVTRLNEELLTLRKMSEDFDRLINDKEMSHEKHLAELMRLRKELEGKCETYEGEMEILQTLVAEQKTQLIESYKENEHGMNMKLLDLQQRDEQITQLRAEISDLRERSESAGNQISDDLRGECEKLRESLRINKALVAEQVNELSNKQETIETLNQQIIDLYKTMEENANKLIEKEDELADVQDLLNKNNKELDALRKDNTEQKSVVDKLLSELHSHKTNMPHLETNLQRMERENQELDASNKALEQRNKDQLEKLKKYAASLKKRTAHCLDLEAKVKELEKSTASPQQPSDDNKLQERIHDLEAQLTALQKEKNETDQALKEKIAELKELQNDMAEKAERETSTSPNEASDWGDFGMETPTNSDTTKELAEKCSMIAHLEKTLKRTENDLLSQNEEIQQLHSKLNAENTQNDNLLASKIATIQMIEVDLNRAQSELLYLREQLKEEQQKSTELQSELRKSEESIEQQNQRHEEEQRTWEEKMKEQEQQLVHANEDLKAKSLKFEKLKVVLKERVNKMNRLQAELQDLKSKMSLAPEEEVHVEPPIERVQLETSNATASTQSNASVTKEEHDALKDAYEKLNEKYNTDKSNFEETIARLHTLHDGIQAKLQEDMSYIETLEQENAKFKEKTCKLEECIASIEERRASIERRANLLDAQMQSRDDEYTKTEDELIYRLNMLSEHDDVIAQRLIDTQEEKDDLQERVDRQQTEFSKLSSNYSKLQREFETYKEEVTSNLETENQELKDKLKAVNQELERIRSVYDAKLAAKTTEIDELECELSDQLEKINAEKRSTLEELEKARDESTELKDEIVRLKESLNAAEQARQELEREVTWLRMQAENSQQDQYELQELRMQTMQDKTEIENLRHQIETLASNHEIELQALRTQISELDTLRMQVGQNQTDDQVFIETENKRLTDLLAEKEAVIENYQRQNLQLQMVATTTQPNQSQPHAEDRDRDRWQRELGEKNEMCARLQRDFAAIQMEFQKCYEANNELQSQLMEKNREIEHLRNSMPRHAMATATATVTAPVTTSTASSTQPHLHGGNVIPAPPMFFAAEPSPFDEIVQMRTIDTALEGVAPSRDRRNDAISQGVEQEQPTIEDLQRNVSDLEKHAHDLENKLAVRNQRDGDLEDRLREMQNRCNETENRLHDRELQLQMTQLELLDTQSQNAMRKEHESTTNTNLEQLRKELEVTRQELADRDRLVAELREQLAAVSAAEQQTKPSQDDALARMQQLQTNLQNLETMLQERDRELNQLKRSFDEEKHLRESAKSLDNQIIPGEMTNLQVGDTKEAIPTLDMFFGNSSAPEFENLVVPAVSGTPVVEEPIVPKKAYVCYPGGETKPPSGAAAFDLGEDWGDTWGGSEALAEAEHLAKTSAAPQSLVPREQQLTLQLQEETERNQELQLALERSEQQKQELQVKSGKLMKKLKEYKVKMDELQVNANANASASAFRTSTDTSSMFSELDATIQEELKEQIKKLEAKLDEDRKVYETFTAEKEKLLKRIDVLEAGNERMSEMKERQDMDVRMYQTRIRELQEQLLKLEDWSESPPAEASPRRSGKEAKPAAVSEVDDTADEWETLKAEMEKQLSELRAEVQDANGDRQELQALLDDEKANVVRAEETVKTLQQQISELNESTADRVEEQSRYSELNGEYQALLQKCKNLQEANEKLKSANAAEQLKVGELQDVEKKLRNDISEYERRIAELQRETEALKGENRRANDGLAELQSQILTLQTQNQELSAANQELRGSVNIPGDGDDARTSEWHLEREKLEKEIAELKAEIARLRFAPALGQASSLYDNADELSALLQEKESEILHLKQRIEDLLREDQTEKLVLEILTKNQEIHLLKMQVKNLEDDKQELEHNLTLQITKEIEASRSTANDAENAQLRENVKKWELKVHELLEEKKHMEEELKVLNNHIMESIAQEDKMKAASLELDMKNIEIAELRKSLESIKAGLNNNNGIVATSSSSSGVDVAALNAQWESVVEQKCSEIAQMWREHLERRETEFRLIEERLKNEIASLRSAESAPALVQQHQQVLSAETTATSTPVSESTSVSGTSSSAPSKDGTPHRARHVTEEHETEADAIIEKMQAALESQEMEIVTLKEQLAIRSAEYARLAAQHDPFKLQSTLSHSGMNTGLSTSLESASPARRHTSSAGDNSLVPKSELDLALYMLHQRDMRCEEMTVELVSLLEERDTLQLKLSNTLRQVELIKAQTHYVEPATTPQGDTSLTLTPSTPSTESSNKAMVPAAVAGDPANELNEKLSQLQTVNHSKDKMIMEEREQRIRQMEKIQQDVAKMPPAAVSELVGTDLAQSGQSPSSVLLNWLWGNKSNSDGGFSN